MNANSKIKTTSDAILFCLSTIELLEGFMCYELTAHAHYRRIPKDLALKAEKEITDFIHPYLTMNDFLENKGILRNSLIEAKKLIYGNWEKRNEQLLSLIKEPNTAECLHTVVGPSLYTTSCDATITYSGKYCSSCGKKAKVLHTSNRYKGKTYFWVGAKGQEVSVDASVDTDSELDKVRYLLGNYYNTEDEADKAARKRKAAAKIKRAIADKNAAQGWTAVFDGSQENFYIQIIFPASGRPTLVSHSQTRMLATEIEYYCSEQTLKEIIEDKEILSAYKVLFSLKED